MHFGGIQAPIIGGACGLRIVDAATIVLPDAVPAVKTISSRPWQAGRVENK